jgi:hypothetical protein
MSSPKAEREHLALPPCQGTPAFVGLLVEVLRRFAPFQLVEPDELALRRVDQRPVLTGTGTVGREDVARRGIAVRHGDRQDRGLDAGHRVEALIVGGRRLWVSESRSARRRIWSIDAELKGDRPAAARLGSACVARPGSAGVDHSVDSHALAGVERGVGHKARAVALRVGLHAPGVGAAALPLDGNRMDLRGRLAQEADLRVGVRRVGFRGRRDIEWHSFQLGAVIQRGGQARWGLAALSRAVRAGLPATAQCDCE